MTTKRFSIQTVMACAALSLLANAYGDPAEEQGIAYSFGVIADCQYCAVEGQGVRKYSQSPAKLTNCVAHFNTLPLEFAIHLGDFIDRDFKSFDVLNPIYSQLSMAKYHVLGNHDFSVADEFKAQVPDKMGMPARYYDFAIQGWRHVVIDGNDVSFHAHPKGSEKHAAAALYYETNNLKAPKWNGAVGPDQLAWLRTVLKKADENKESVIIYCHFPVYPVNGHNLWNAEEVIALLEEFPCVKAYMNGHNHKGNYGEKNGIHYLTFKGMVDTEQTSYAVVKVSRERLNVVGFGREEGRELEIKK